MARLITGSLTRCSGWSTVMWPLINHMTAAMKWHGNMHGASLITQEPKRRAVNVRQSSSRDADGSFMSVEANPQPIQLWGLKRHFRRLDDKSQNLAATFRVCVCEMFCVSAFGKCCFCADHMLMPVSHTLGRRIFMHWFHLVSFCWASALGDRFCSHETNHSLKMTGSCVEVNLPYTEDILHIKPEKMCQNVGSTLNVPRRRPCPWIVLTYDSFSAWPRTARWAVEISLPPAASYYKVKVFRRHSSSATWS